MTESWLKIVQTRFCSTWCDRLWDINFAFVAPPAGEVQCTSSDVFNKHLSHICKVLCCFDEKWIIYNQFCLNVHFCKSSSVAKLLMLASICYPNSRFIWLGRKIIPTKFRANLSKSWGVEAKNLIWTKFKMAEIFSCAKGPDLCIALSRSTESRKKRILLLTLTVEELRPKM